MSSLTLAAAKAREKQFWLRTVGDVFKGTHQQ